jgi:peptidoglycan/xylan/chitin deacetylase (PgdA/CDA1 family)
VASESRFGRFAYWFRKRGMTYMLLRLRRLVARYGLTSRKAQGRTLALVELLAKHDAAPTLAAPGRLVKKHQAFMRQLQDAGVELAVHGFDHVDFRSLTPAGAAQQFEQAASAYAASGLRFSGFRCPYLSFSHDMAAGVPQRMFRYSSNEAVWWDVVEGRLANGSGAIFEALEAFYSPRSASASVVLPRQVGQLIELPVSLPDDLQLLDGLNAGESGIRDAWLEVLRRSHERGELFVVLVHPESFYDCAGALNALVASARSLSPTVWIARLDDLADWWAELATFSVSVDGRSVAFSCTDRATVLVRGLGPLPSARDWFGRYSVLTDRTLELAISDLPFIGVAEGVPERVVATLRGMGYVVERGPAASACSTYLDERLVSPATTDREVVELIDRADAPLVRFWQWPAAARSALAVTGDLDSLSLLDYVARLVTL